MMAAATCEESEMGATDEVGNEPGLVGWPTPLPPLLVVLLSVVVAVAVLLSSVLVVLLVVLLVADWAVLAGTTLASPGAAGAVACAVL